MYIDYICMYVCMYIYIYLCSGGLFHLFLTLAQAYMFDICLTISLYKPLYSTIHFYYFLYVSICFLYCPIFLASNIFGCPVYTEKRESYSELISNCPG